jgi:hypothetical protein
MHISVKYHNGKTGSVNTSQLDDLISSGRIRKFLRSDGWVTIGADPVRREKRIHYDGPEKRRVNRRAVKVRHK